MNQDTVTPDTTLIFLNAFEAAIALFTIALFVTILFRLFESWKDFEARFRRMLQLDFQGGPYDMLIALLVLYVGLFMRAETLWEWRFLDFPLSITRVCIGVAIKVLATFCLIRLLLPAKNFNLVAGMAFTASFAFALASILLK